MISPYNIYAVAVFEFKTIARSWFLRIFAAIAFVIIFFTDLVLFVGIADSVVPRSLYGISSSISYLNTLYFNVAQAIIAVFLAADFLRRDNKLDTTEAIYIHSITNADYVAGKFIGIFLIFFLLNIFNLLMAFIFNIFGLVPIVNFAGYLFHLFFLSVPTLIFMIGFTFFLMTIIRNQAVTFIILLGYIGVTLFYLAPKISSVFDFTGFFMPYIYSDFIGFGQLTNLLLQKSIYIFFGLSSIFFTIYFFKRLPQSRIIKNLTIIFAIFFFCGSATSAYLYHAGIDAGKNLRSEMKKMNNQYYGRNQFTITDCKLKLDHQHDEIECNVNISLVNDSKKPSKKIILALNPALVIKQVLYKSQPVEYKRELHLLHIFLPSHIAPGKTIKLELNYEGAINDEAAYIDISEVKRSNLNRIQAYIAEKIYSHISPDFLLLTPENMWYPTAGTTYAPNFPFNQNKDFVNYELKVRTNPELCVLSQGRKSKDSNGNFQFLNKQPLPGISLTIGQYSRDSISVDSVKYNIYTLEKHDYYKEYLNEIGDTLVPLIKELKEDFERDQNLPYLFSEFSIVEVPIQFYTYQRIWTNIQEKIQPEIVFLPENGVTLEDADFLLQNKRRERHGNRGNQVITPIEQQSQMFRSFVKRTFFDAAGEFRFRGQAPEDNAPNPYSIFPLYFSYINSVDSREFPMFNYVLENYLKSESHLGTNQFVRSIMGLTSSEKAMNALNNRSLVEVIPDSSFRQYLYSTLEVKGNYLWKLIESEFGTESLIEFLHDYFNKNKFTNSSFAALNDEMILKHNLDLNPILNNWYNQQKLPGFYINNIKNYSFLSTDREKFSVSFDITNPTETDGIVNVSFHSMNNSEDRSFFARRRQRSSDNPSIAERNFKVPSNSTKSVAIILDEEPDRFTLNTMVSKNLPLLQEYTLEEFKNKKKDGVERAIILESISPYSFENEIIVDNEDKGFSSEGNETRSWLKRILDIQNESDEKYIGIRFWNLPNNWRATILSEAYGKFVHSAHYTRGGNGEKTAIWKADINMSGYYDVYCYNVKPNTGYRRGGDYANKVEYHYTIFHDDGDDEIVLDISEADVGWNLLGSFYFSKGVAKVKVSNETQGRAVFADAVKWVFSN